MATDGGRHSTDSVVGRDRVSQPPRRIHGIAQAACCLHAIGSVHALFAYPPNGGPLSPRRRQPTNSEQFSSAAGTCHWVGGRVIVRQTHWEGSPCPVWDGGTSLR